MAPLQFVGNFHPPDKRSSSFAKNIFGCFSRAIKRFELTFVARQLGHQRDRGERGVTLMGALRMLY